MAAACGTKYHCGSYCYWFHSVGFTKEGNNMIGKILDASKRHQVLPRVMMIVMTYQYFVVTNWFMSLTEPTNS